MKMMFALALMAVLSAFPGVSDSFVEDLDVHTNIAPVSIVRDVSDNANAITVHPVYGYFTRAEEADNETYYNFEGGENWHLSESELGFIPEENVEYTLYVSDNGTTTCETEYHPENCECFMWDDFFISMKTVPMAIVERVEDNDMAVVEVVYHGEAYYGDVCIEWINQDIYDCMPVSVDVVSGTFEELFKTKKQTYYNFYSNDGRYEWVISSLQTDFEPNSDEVYNVFIGNNSTDDVNDDYFICAEY